MTNEGTTIEYHHLSQILQQTEKSHLGAIEVLAVHVFSCTSVSSIHCYLPRVRWVWIVGDNRRHYCPFSMVTFLHNATCSIFISPIDLFIHLCILFCYIWSWTIHFLVKVKFFSFAVHPINLFSLEEIIHQGFSVVPWYYPVLFILSVAQPIDCSKFAPGIKVEI